MKSKHEYIRKIHNRCTCTCVLCCCLNYECMYIMFMQQLAGQSTPLRLVAQLSCAMLYITNVSIVHLHCRNPKLQNTIQHESQRSHFQRIHCKLANSYGNQTSNTVGRELLLTQLYTDTAHQITHTNPDTLMTHLNLKYMYSRTEYYRVR